MHVCMDKATHVLAVWRNSQQLSRVRSCFARRCSDLSDNELAELASTVFEELADLKILRLNGNKFAGLDSGFFKGNTKLTELCVAGLARAQAWPLCCRKCTLAACTHSADAPHSR